MFSVSENSVYLENLLPTLQNSGYVFGSQKSPGCHIRQAVRCDS